jgi:hypothetical protein
MESIKGSVKAIKQPAKVVPGHLKKTETETG